MLHRKVPVDNVMKGKLGKTRSSVYFFTRRGDVKKTTFPTKQANRNLKGELYKNVRIISADFLIGQSSMSTRTGGASSAGPPLIFNFTPHFKVLEMVGSGMERGQPEEGPSGLDVGDAVFVNKPGSRGRLDLRARSAKNDQDGAGETTVVCEDELGEGLCAIRKLKTWMVMVHLEVQKGCIKGASGCTKCCRRACVCNCKICGKLFRGVAHGEVRDKPLSRQGLNGMPKGLFRALEEAGVVPPGTAKEVSGISLRAGGATEAAACGMEKHLPAGHGRWKSLNGTEAYHRNDKRKFERVPAVLHALLRQTRTQRQ